MLTKRKPKILIVEDNALYNQLIAEYLRRQFLVDQVTTIQGALSCLAETNRPYDVVLLDHHLPDGDSLQIIPFLKQDMPDTKVCILTEEALESIRIRALQMGADAFLTKPLTCRSVALHLQALLRRGLRQDTPTIAFHDVLLDLQQRWLIRENNAQKIQLSGRERDFMQTFIATQDGQVTKDDLARIFYKSGSKNITKSAIHVTIQRLRRKLSPLNVRIESVYGMGYRLATEI